MTGWIKLHRSIINHWMYSFDEPDKTLAWIDLVLNANHASADVMIKGRKVHVERGQQIRSEVTLSKTWKWSRGKVRRFLMTLEKEGMIVQQKSELTSRITICNYSTYQSSEKHLSIVNSTAGSTAGSTTDGHPTVHKQECKNVRMEEINHMFDLFWNAGMRKTNKQAAVKKFNLLAKKQNGSLKEWTDNLVDDIGRRILSGQLGFDHMHPSTYLNGERWKDEIQASSNDNQNEFMI